MLIRNVLLFADGVITLLCGFLLFYIFFFRTNCKGYFHLLWSLGFIFYGLEIFLRLFPHPNLLFVASFFVFALILWFSGLGLILGMLKKFLIIVSLLTALLHTGILLNLVFLSYVSVIVFLILFTFGIFLLKTKYGGVVYPILFGWIMLTALNILFIFRSLPESYIDTLASVAKIIIVFGILNSNFQYIGTSISPILKRVTCKPRTLRANFTLVKCGRVSRLKELNWIKQIVLNNLANNLKTTLITIYDSISTLELEELELLNNKNVNVVRVLREIKRENIGTNPTIIKDDLTSLGLLISNIIRQNEKEEPQTIIVYPLSWLILTHGWRNIYLLLSTKISELKESQTHLLAFYYPKVHNDKTISYTLEKMAEQIISL